MSRPLTNRTASLADPRRYCSTNTVHGADGGDEGLLSSQACSPLLGLHAGKQGPLKQNSGLPLCWPTWQGPDFASGMGTPLSRNSCSRPCRRGGVCR